MRDWLRFLSLEFSAAKANKILKRFGSPSALFAASEAEWQEAFSPADVVAIQRVAQEEPVIPSALAEGKVQIVTQADETYPPTLLDLPDPPVALCVKGTLEERDRFGIAIVGTRNATPYGKMVAEKLARDFAEAGVTVISGGALGVDARAHQGAVKGNGRTLAILGSGLLNAYPQDNQGLFETIAQGHGAVVSEFHPKASPDAWRFPARNRLIAAWGVGVVVVEAPVQSGALITAQFAAETGREVFAVPGSIDNEKVRGCHQLIREGAALIENAQEVLDLLGVQRAPQRQTTMPLLSEVQEKLLKALSLQPQYMDSLARELSLPIHQAQVELTNLELMGLARRMPGGTFVRAL